MKNKRTIRQKVMIAMCGLGGVIGLLAYGGFRGAYAYRDIAKIVSTRASELPIASKLTREVDLLRYSHRRQEDPEYKSLLNSLDTAKRWADRNRFQSQLHNVKACLIEYEARLNVSSDSNLPLDDRTAELQVIDELSVRLAAISQRSKDADLHLRNDALDEQSEDLYQLSELAHKLPTFLQSNLQSTRDEVRTRYRAWIGLVWTCMALSICLMSWLFWYARKNILIPFKRLLHGSRRVAQGEFDYRIEMDSDDELSELANAINTGNEGFVRIQRDLHTQVRERSQEVIRNEQLASVGFLAAGVAHEINSPLASISWSAEALETRLHKLLYSDIGSSFEDDETANHDSSTTTSTRPEQASNDDRQGTLEQQGTPELPTNNQRSSKAVALREAIDRAAQNIDTLRNYLSRIQKDAFRCKGITERLLDFSRLGQAEKKQWIDMKSVVEDVIDMVQHLSQYRNYKIAFESCDLANCWASPQEMKQVVLNLLTNALDSIPSERQDGLVTISLDSDTENVQLTIVDNGCGMTEEVRNHLFEPFFTRRRDGRGTGLGLPITSRIIADHGGRIQANSSGPDQGSRFVVQIPNRQPEADDAFPARAA